SGSLPAGSVRFLARAARAPSNWRRGYPSEGKSRHFGVRKFSRNVTCTEPGSADDSDLGNTAKRLPSRARSIEKKPVPIDRTGVSGQTRGLPASNESPFAV